MAIADSTTQLPLFAPQGLSSASQGWRRDDLDTLYRGFGFVIESRRKYDIVKHPEHPDIRTTLPALRSVLYKGCINEAIQNIEELIRLEREEREK